MPESETASEKPDNESTPEQDPGSELDLRFWSVISFDRRLASNLTYSEAVEELGRHRIKGVSGLCIVTDQAAGRLGSVED